MKRCGRFAAVVRLSMLHCVALACFSCAPTRETLPAPCHTAVKVMSFNIRYGTADDGPNQWQNRRSILLDLLREARPDVLGLQEALLFQIDEIQAELAGYTRIGVGRDDGDSKGEFSCVLYRTARFTSQEGGTFWFSDTPETPGSITWGNDCTRICSWARLTDRQSGASFYVYNLHLDHKSQPSREKSVAFLAARIRARAKPHAPVVVTGDFNAQPDNPAMRYLLGHAPLPGATEPPPLVDALLGVSGEQANAGTFHGFTGKADAGRIDYILVSPQIAVRQAEVVTTSRNGTYPSDHFPVAAVVCLSAP